MLLLLVAVLCSYSFPVESVVRNNSVVLARSFLRCLSSVNDGATLPKDINDQSPAEDILAGTLGCIQLPIARGLEIVASARGSDLELLGGSLILKRTGGPGVTEAPSRSGESDNDTGLASTHDMFVQLDALSRSYEMEVNVYPGVTARLGRSSKDQDAVDLSFRLDGIFSDRDDRQMKDYDEDDEDYGEDDLDEPRHKHKKKKFLKKLSKKVKKYLPLLAIPLAIQMMLLPLYITVLKIMAIKSIMLGKMTLLLLMLNVFRNIQQRQEDDERNAQIASEYYGLTDGIEYGSWINRRKRRRRRSNNEPYVIARK